LLACSIPRAGTSVAIGQTVGFTSPSTSHCMARWLPGDSHANPSRYLNIEDSGMSVIGLHKGDSLRAPRIPGRPRGPPLQVLPSALSLYNRDSPFDSLAETPLGR